MFHIMDGYYVAIDFKNNHEKVKVCSSAVCIARWLTLIAC